MLDVNTLMNIVETHATQHHDGHLTILRFTTHWKGMYGTPYEIYEDLGEGDVRSVFEPLPSFDSLDDLLDSMAREPKKHTLNA